MLILCIKKNSDSKKIVVHKYHLCRRPGHSAEAGGRVGKQVLNPGDDYGFAKCSNGSLATRKFQVFSIPVKKGWRLSGKQVVTLMNENFGVSIVG